MSPDDLAAHYAKVWKKPDAASAAERGRARRLSGGDFEAA
jgi:hypothetical protein